MDFSDESYVRLYTRKTLTHHLLGWEGRAVMHEMLSEFDRAGVFAYRGEAARCVAAVTGLPEPVAALGLARLLETETWRVGPSSITWPTYVTAQSCSKTERARQRESRLRRSAESVTNCDPLSQPVTTGHVQSHPVTPSLAQPILSDPNLAQPDPPVVPPGTRTPRKPRAVRKWTQVPDDWEPKKSHRDKAFEMGWTPARLELEVQKYRLWDFRTPRRDPDRTFDGWLLKEQGANLGQPGASNGHSRGPRHPNEDVYDHIARKATEGENG